jgi:septum formation protein
LQVLVLASGSQYRAQLLQRLGCPFQSLSPDVDESAQSEDETPADLATRLARLKAHAPVLNQFAGTAQSDLIVIASDQVASLNQKRLGKPGSLHKACEQLRYMQGQSVTFHTALFMRHTGTEKHFSALDTTIATLRPLSDEEIERYVAAERPIDCAGSFKAEALGISLFDAIESNDPTALVGLPMISVCRGLRQFGISIP